MLAAEIQHQGALPPIPLPPHTVVILANAWIHFWVEQGALNCAAKSNGFRVRGNDGVVGWGMAAGQSPIHLLSSTHTVVILAKRGDPSVGGRGRSLCNGRKVKKFIPEQGSARSRGMTGFVGAYWQAGQLRQSFYSPRHHTAVHPRRRGIQFLGIEQGVL